MKRVKGGDSQRESSSGGGAGALGAEYEALQKCHAVWCRTKWKGCGRVGRVVRVYYAVLELSFIQRGFEPPEDLKAGDTFCLREWLGMARIWRLGCAAASWLRLVVSRRDGERSIM